MTLNEKKPSLLFGSQYNEAKQGYREIWVEIEDKEHLLLAEIIADESTLRDRGAFCQRYPGAEFNDDVYEQEFATNYDRVREFADTHNLKYSIIYL
jgi:hypothetical protein